MEPNKLEADFQKKLNQRKINASANSWDRLDAMLSVAEEKKPKRSYDWMYIAAGIIGFIFVGTLFFSQTEELVDVRRNNVVLQNKEITKPSEDGIQEQTKMTNSSSVPSQSVAVISNTNKNQKSVIRIIETEQTVHCNVCPEEKSIITRAPIAIGANWRSNQKTGQLNPLPVKDVSADELLASVEPSSKNGNSNPSIKVDAHNLLSQVDGELEISFREKVINTIDKNYKTVKVALANRNLQ